MGFSYVASCSSESAHSIGKQSKNHRNRPYGEPKTDPSSTKIALRSAFRAISGGRVNRRALFERSWGDLVGRKGLSERLVSAWRGDLARSKRLARRLGARAQSGPPRDAQSSSGNIAIDVCMYICIDVYMYRCIYVYMFIRIYEYMNICRYVYL